MADSLRSPDAKHQGTPPLVKVSLVVALIAGLIVVLAIGGVFGSGHDPGRHSAPSSVAEGPVEIPVTADSFAFDPDEITVSTSDDVAVVQTSSDDLHDFTIDELDAHVAAEPGENATEGFRADQPGRYTFYCSVPGHREAGMEGTLIVTDDQEQAGG